MFRPSSTLKPVIYDVNPEEYHAPQKAARGTPEFVMSRTELELFAICPRKWQRGIPRKQTDSLTWGSLLDVIVLTPQHFEHLYAPHPEKYATKRMKCPKCESLSDSATCKACKTPRVEVDVELSWNWNSTHCIAWGKEQMQQGWTPVNPETCSEAWAAAARLKEDPEIVAILEASKKQVQVNVEWVDEDSGIVIPFKALIDILPDAQSEFGNTIWDFKTSRDASMNKWTRQLFTDGLHFQAAIYLDAVNAALGLEYRHFGHIISENTKPYEPVARPMHDDWLVMGRTDYRMAFDRYVKAVKTGVFPGYSNDCATPEPWMLWQTPDEV